MSVGQLLQQYRKSQHFSQLALASEAEVSTRHISFIETGRSQPSRQILLTLSNALGLAHRDVNLLMRAAGYSAQYQNRSIESPVMQSVRDALSMMLENHSPYPAVVIDKDWNVLMKNTPYQLIHDGLPQEAKDMPYANNVLDLLLAPNGLRSVVENWTEVATYLLRARAREEALSPYKENSLLERLLRYPDLPDWKKMDDSEQEQPMILLKLNLAGIRLSMFSTIATFGTAADVSLQELRIESYFPADEFTKNFFKGLG